MCHFGPPILHMRNMSSVKPNENVPNPNVVFVPVVIRADRLLWRERVCLVAYVTIANIVLMYATGILSTVFRFMM